MIQVIYKIGLGLSLLFLFSSCDAFSRFMDKEEPVESKLLAKVSDQSLFEADLPKNIQEKLSGKDSLSFLKDFVDKWVYEQLMMEKAKDFLPKENIRSIERKVHEYAGASYAYEYEKELLAQKVDFEVEEQDIEQFYNQNKQSLSLSHDIVKGRYFFMDANTSDQDTIKALFKNLTEENLEKLESAGFQKAKNFNLKSQWLPWNQFQSKLPEKVKRPESFLRKNKFHEMGDSLTTCYVFIEDFRLKGDITPMEYYEQEIKKIIINKRREEYLKRIRKSVYNEAKNSKSVELFF